MHINVRDALQELDEANLPPALQAGDSLLHVRGGKPDKYSVLKSFRRMQISRQHKFAESRLPRPHAATFQDPNRTEKIKMLTDLLARLERMVDASPK